MFGKVKYKKDILIFLDVDGVLNTTNSRASLYEVKEDNVKALKILVEKLEKKGYIAKLILSSTWRIGYEKDLDRCLPQIKRLVMELEEKGLSIYDKTPVFNEQTRDVEIQRYIRGYRLKKEDFLYLILDDDVSVFDKETLKKLCFYRVNEKTGLTMTDVAKIMKLVIRGKNYD